MFDFLTLSNIMRNFWQNTVFPSLWGIFLCPNHPTLWGIARKKSKRLFFSEFLTMFDLFLLEVQENIKPALWGSLKLLLHLQSRFWFQTSSNVVRKSKQNSSHCVITSCWRCSKMIKSALWGSLELCCTSDLVFGFRLAPTLWGSQDGCFW